MNYLKKNSGVFLVLGLALAVLPFVLSRTALFQQAYLILALMWLLGASFVLYYLYLTIYPSHSRKIQALKILFLVLLLAFTVFIMREVGITFSTAEPITTFAIGSSFTCPSNAQYYGLPGCRVFYTTSDSGFQYAPISYDGYVGLLQPGGVFTCTQEYNILNVPLYISCFAQFEVPVTSSTLTTTFTETGLPSYYVWYVYYDGMEQSNMAGDAIAFQSSPGTYSFSVVPIDSYSASPSSGVLQAGSTLNIQFTPVTTTSTSGGGGSTQTSSSQIVGSVSVNFLGALLSDLAYSFIPIGR